MPTPDDLNRLRALLTQLEAIGDVRRGELIQAEDWNSLVLAVADIARAVLAAAAAVAVPAHEHKEQVIADWLAPPLRDLLERGPLSDPAVQKRLAEIEQTLRRFNDTLDANEQKVEEFRGRMTDVSSRDLEREAAITSVRRSLEAVVDPRPDLQNMRTTLGVIQRDMSTVLEAASRLNVGGAVVDMRAVLTRIAQLEQLRDRFRLANGELLDAATIERRIAEIANRSVSQGQLDDILRNRQVEISPNQLAGVETRVGANLREQVSGALNSFRTDVNADIANRFQDINAIVDARVNDALPAIRGTITAELSARIDAAQQAAITNAVAAAQRAIDASAATLRGEMSARVTEVLTGIGATVRAEVTQRLATEMTVIRASLDASTARLDTLTTQVNRIDEAQRQHATTLAAIPQQFVALRNELRGLVVSEIDVRTTALNRTVTDRLTAFEKAQNDQFTALAKELQNRAADTSRAVAVEAAQAETRSLRAALLAEMRGIAREEIAVAIRDQLRPAVTEAVREQTAAIPGLVAAEVRRVSGSTRPVTPVAPIRPGGPQ
jgi:hypothetical protein